MTPGRGRHPPPSLLPTRRHGAVLSADPHACPRVRESISARLDNESPALDADQVRAHVATCAGCRDFHVAAQALHRSVRLTPSCPVPDLQDQIVAAIPDAARMGARRARRRRQGRVVLGLAGAAQAFLALLVLFGPTNLHLAREVAGFELAIGAAMLLAALRPHRFAAGILPVLAVTACIVVWSALVDVVTGMADTLAEVPHLLPAVGALVLWRAVPPGDGRDRHRALQP